MTIAVSRGHKSKRNNNNNNKVSGFVEIYSVIDRLGQLPEPKLEIAGRDGDNLN